MKLLSKCLLLCTNLFAAQSNQDPFLQVMTRSDNQLYAIKNRKQLAHCCGATNFACGVCCCCCGNPAKGSCMWTLLCLSSSVCCFELEKKYSSQQKTVQNQLDDLKFNKRQ